MRRYYCNWRKLIVLRNFCYRAWSCHPQTPQPGAAVVERHDFPPRLRLVSVALSRYIWTPSWRWCSEMIPIELLLFMAAMVAIWRIRDWQLRSLEQQERYLCRFAEAVTAWRSQPGIPTAAREAIEVLVGMTISKSTTRRFAILMLKRQPFDRTELDDNPFWHVRQPLDKDQREAFDWLLLTFFLAITYSDWLTGPFIRRVRFGGLSRQTQAEVAIETVFSQSMGRAAHA